MKKKRNKALVFENQVEYKTKIPFGSGKEIGMLEFEAFTLTIRKGYYSSGSLETAHVNVDFTDGSSIGLGSVEIDKKGNWKYVIDNQIQNLVILNKDLCVKQMEIKNLEKKIEPLQESIDYIQKDIFRMVEKCEKKGLK